MGDPRRFKLLAEFIDSKVSKTARIADIASGKGKLTQLLWTMGYRNLTMYESKLGSPFSSTDAVNHDVLHPDDATFEIVKGARKYDKDFLLVPCCWRQAVVDRVLNACKGPDLHSR